MIDVPDFAGVLTVTSGRVAYITATFVRCGLYRDVDCIRFDNGFIENVT